jgi:hypothetical protein
MRVFENRVLTSIFGPKRDEVTGQWRKLHNVIMLIMWWAGHVARMRDESKVYKVLVGKPERRRPLERPRCR